MEKQKHSCKLPTGATEHTAISDCKSPAEDINTERGQSPTESQQSPCHQTMTFQNMTNQEEEWKIGEDEESRAPIELFAEFLKSLADKDYILAQKLCQMILVFEPDNPEAKEFLPLIEEKLLLGQEESEDDESSSSTEDSDSGRESSESSDSSSEQEAESKEMHKGCRRAPVSE
ncbi:hypothetical protein GJAV_G00204630 [Gymnothorax javanicus]|nr:hypothetical protein GJAV_G00204630 [Gymnothorax javanicus]